MMPHHFANTQCPSVNRDIIHAIIKKFRDAFPDNFDKCGLIICSKCDGSGLSIKPNQQGITVWQPDNYCQECKGFGVTGITKIYDEYLCKGCKGSGCKICNDKGSVDWISNVVKR
jgi:hypothetical protein